MSYKVLYRKYRPDNFENIIGQDYIIKTLKNSIIKNKISHAYIFSGPRGTGKTSTAKVFAKAINCLDNVSGSPCGKCEFCTNYLENPDIIEMDAASNNGVDEIRNLIDNVKLTPTNGKYKVYIIDEVHMLTTSAFNALLLTIEEPPAHAIFILATTNVENVPITILSRCQRFDFQKIKLEDIVEELRDICQKEDIQIEEDALEEIAYLSEGGLRDALSLLDQLSKNSDKITLELIESQIKSISRKEINDLLDSVDNDDMEKCLKLIGEYRNRALDYKTLVKKIISAASKRAKEIKITGKYKRLYFDDYKKLIMELAESISKTNINVDSYTILEMILLDYFSEKKEMKHDDKEDVPVEKNKEETILKSNLNNCHKENELSRKIIDIRINNCFVNAKKSFLEIAKNEINRYNLSVSVDGKIKSVMTDSTVVTASDTNLILVCGNDHNVEVANKMLREIENSIAKEIQKEYKIVFLTAEEWKIEKEKYIENLKNHVEYKYILEEDNDNSRSIEINDVFDISKVEII